MSQDESVAYWMSYLPEVRYRDLMEYAVLLRAGRQALASGKFDRAEGWLREAVACAREISGDDGELLSNALLLLADAIRNQGRKEESDITRVRAAQALCCDC
ncbi:MAG: hypothetical protein U0105_11015 [Candidatus Obscuribacterales bacterium]|jgi:hypothetical protein